MSLPHKSCFAIKCKSTPLVYKNLFQYKNIKIVFLVIIFLAKFKKKCKEILAPLGRESKILRNCWKKVHLGFSGFSDFFGGKVIFPEYRNIKITSQWFFQKSVLCSILPNSFPSNIRKADIGMK
jgi:hypothetical protein